MYAGKLVAIIVLAAAAMSVLAHPLEARERPQNEKRRIPSAISAFNELNAREPEPFHFGHGAGHGRPYGAREELDLFARAEGQHPAHHPAHKPHHKPHHKLAHKPHHKKPHHKAHHRRPHGRPHHKAHHKTHHRKPAHHHKPAHHLARPHHKPGHKQHHARDQLELMARDRYTLDELWKGIKASFHHRRADEDSGAVALPKFPKLEPCCRPVNWWQPKLLTREDAGEDSGAFLFKDVAHAIAAGFDAI